MNEVLDRKIHQRTVELEANRNELLRVLKERELRSDRVYRSIVEVVNMIKGLCLAAKDELKEPALDNYLDKIDETAGRLRGLSERAG